MATQATSDPLDSFSPSLAGGSLIAGRYRLDAIIGRGGMATVWRAHDERLGRDVAVKICRPTPLQPQAPLAEERFSGALLHPNIVSIFDAGEIPPPGSAGTYIVMEYVDGTTAHQVAPVAWRQAVDIVRQAADGLAAAHEQGIVHCDVKPGNLLIDRRGRVLVADFGIAMEVNGELGEFVHGSPAYIAPERLTGDCASPRVDVYGLGGVLAYLITGQRPDDGPVSLPLGCPSWIAEMITRARARRPEDRYADAGEFRDAIDTAAIRVDAGTDRVLREEVRSGPNVDERAGTSLQIISHPTRVGQMTRPQSAQETAAISPSPVRVAVPRTPDKRRPDLRRQLAAFIAAGMIGLLLLLTVSVLVSQIVSVDSAVAGPPATMIDVRHV
jgi:serine/threonine protein kinase